MIELFKNTLIVVRHGESDPHTGRLTERGLHQSQILGVKIAQFTNNSNDTSTRILTGPAPRLLETTRIVSNITKLPFKVVSRLSTAASTRNMESPSPEYSDSETIRAVLSEVVPETALLIIIAHSEMMNDLLFLHSVAKDLCFDNYRNATGYIVNQSGKASFS